MDTYYKKWKIHIGNGYPYIRVDHKNIKLHVFIWEQKNGERPKGYNVHHKDNNKLNYDINNLELLTIGDHRRIHNGLIRENGIWKYKFCRLCNKTLPLNKFKYISTRKNHSTYCRVCTNKKVASIIRTDEMRKKHNDYIIKWRAKNRLKKLTQGLKLQPVI